jgi:Putative adhesin
MMARKGTLQIVAGLVLGTIMAVLFSVYAHADTEQFHRTVPLAASGTVSIDNLDGFIHITGWDRNEVSIDATKHGPKQRTSQVQIEVEASPNSVAIRATYPERRNWLGFSTTDDTYTHGPDRVTIDYTLSVPRTARLASVNDIGGEVDVAGVTGGARLNCVAGAVTAKALSGEVQIHSISGRVDVSFADFTSASRVDSVSGAIIAALPANANAELRAESMSAGVKSDFPLSTSSAPGPKHISGKLGSGGPLLALHSISGAVEIRRESTPPQTAATPARKPAKASASRDADPATNTPPHRADR